MKQSIEKNKGVCFRYWLHKRNLTPYEMEIKDPNQSDLVDDVCEYGYFVDSVNLGYDWLVGVTESDYENPKQISYHKLSEISFAYSESDQEQ